MSRKTKIDRKLQVDDRLYFWYVKEDEDWLGFALHVLSEDGEFFVTYKLGQQEKTRHIVVRGRDFGRVSGTGKFWRRFRCPEWADDGKVTPAGVRKLIDWCQTLGAIEEVDGAGRGLPLGGCCTGCGVSIRGMIPLNSVCCHKCGRQITQMVR